MNQEEEQLETLRDIRRMMKESSRFLSLSGLSGVLAGIYALAGTFMAYRFLRNYGEGQAGSYTDLLSRLLLLALVVLVLSLATALLLSARKAARNHQRLFDHSSRRLLWSMGAPLFAGGLFCIALVGHGQTEALLVAPAMLIFYGLSLVAGSQFTLPELRYLGYMEVALGLFCSFYREYGLLFWSAGFGVLHLIYGAAMWYRYDRTH